MKVHRSDTRFLPEAIQWLIQLTLQGMEVSDVEAFLEIDVGYDCNCRIGDGLGRVCERFTSLDLLPFEYD